MAGSLHAGSRPTPKLEPELAARQAERKPPDYGNARFCLKRSSLLTEREQGCYWRLVEHPAPDFIVFAQVRFSQILSTKGGTGEQNYALFGTMSQQVADFVVCRKDLSMVAVIELEDSSHRGKEKRDAAVRDAQRGVGLWRTRVRKGGGARKSD